MLTSAKHMMKLYSMTTDMIYEERGSDWSHQVFTVGTTRLLQHYQTLSLFAKGVACKTKCPIHILRSACHYRLPKHATPTVS